jgi:hypothetical protein
MFSQMKPILTALLLAPLAGLHAPESFQIDSSNISL